MRRSRNDETHDPQLESWVSSAQESGADFPIQNLPFGVFRRDGVSRPRVGVAIGSEILDVAAAFDLGLFSRQVQEGAQACLGEDLNRLMSLGRDHWSPLRRDLSRLLRIGSAAAAHSQQILVSSAGVEMLLPARIGDYTDFYASIFHATNVGAMFRPDNPLLPNYKYLPIGYHGRCSSIVASGTPVRRPSGQLKADGQAAPEFGPCRLLDYEVEVGFFVGPGNPQGTTIPIGAAEEHLFGLCLVNDWSARDIQKWEYQPLGPFLAKSFATTLSPWVVTLDALAPFRIPAFRRAEGDPSPLPYLDSPGGRREGGLGLVLDVHLATAAMRERREPPQRLSRSGFSDMYWTLAQMLTHHASNGCNLRPGDLMASGTVSGPSEGAQGCLLELTQGGSRPLALPSGETRRFLQDGDEVVLTGFCERPGARRIGFGECRGIVKGETVA